MTVVDTYLDAADEVRGDNWAHLPSTQRMWHCNYAALTSAADLPEVDEASVYVISDIMHVGRMAISATEWLEPFVVVVGAVARLRGGA